MKTRIWQRFTATLLLAVALIGRAADNEESKPAPPSEETKPAVIVTDTPPATVPTVPAVPAVTASAPASIIPPKLSLPPLLDQVSRLSKSGADESVIKAYIEKSAPAYQVTGNEILELQEQGVSKSVILSLVENSKTSTPSPEPAPVAAEPVAPVAGAAPVATNVPVATAPLTPEVTDFYDALSPYGTWAVLPDYGWCWQPTVTVVNPAWRPYCDNGSWLWSDSGWYWNSSYSWGWAPFHYGRWFCHGSRGWYWAPDRVWGPSWVCWRNSASYCGWAPLPPGACFTAGLGWSHWGQRVGSDCNFGIASAHFNFVSHGNFTDQHVGRHRLNGHDANTAFAHTKVINNYSLGDNNRVFNHGIGREQIAAARGSAIRPVAVSDAQPQRGNVVGRTFTARTVASQGGVGRGQNAAVGRTVTASVSPQMARSYANAGNSFNQRPTSQFSAANRASATPQFRNNYASASPRQNSIGRSSLSARPSPSFAQRPMTSMNTTRSFAAQRPIASARSYSAPSAAPRGFSSRGSSPAPSMRGSGSSFGSSRGSAASIGGGARNGGGASVGRSASAGRR